MDLNLVVLAGRLAAPPELRHLESGDTVLRYLVTIRSEKPNRVDVLPVEKRGDDDTNGRPLGDPGSRIYVAGCVRRRFWDRDGAGRSRLEIVARHVEFPDEEEVETFTGA